ncbi:MAG: GNAT family N-acetyltransferase [Propionibacteriaceae bacterium]|nr:GNAT family N-acetyltransferase [Propionibacteriaceae bacterium]
MQIRIREVTHDKLAEDTATVAELAKVIWNEYYTPIIGQDQVAYMLTEFQSVKPIARDIVDKGYRYWLAEDIDAGIPVGYCGGAPEDDRLFLSKIYVLKLYRGCGVARAFLNELTAWARELNLSVIGLNVNKDNADSIAAYEKLGFQITGTMWADIGGGFVMDDYTMELAVP